MYQEIARTLDRWLKLRGVQYAPKNTLVDDLGLDSQDLVGLVLEFESLLGRELDEETILAFAQSTIADICDSLARTAGASKLRAGP